MNRYLKFNPLRSGLRVRLDEEKQIWNLIIVVRSPWRIKTTKLLPNLKFVNPQKKCWFIHSSAYILTLIIIPINSFTKLCKYSLESKSQNVVNTARRILFEKRFVWSNTFISSSLIVISACIQGMRYFSPGNARTRGIYLSFCHVVSTPTWINLFDDEIDFVFS